MLEVLSLGAGVQSSAVLMMSIRGELPKLDCAIFADTGWEPRAVYRQLEWLKTQADIPIHVVSAGNIRQDHLSNSTRTTIPFFIDTGGEREGRTFRKCTSEYKVEPIELFMRRELLGLRKGQHAPKHAVIRHWFGISLDEYQRMKPSKVKWKIHYYPLVDARISRQGCIDWILANGYPEPPKSACIGCPFRGQAEWEEMKNGKNTEFQDACSFDDQMRTSTAMRGVPYLHRSLIPLRDITFSQGVHGVRQLSLWDDECDGMCGV